MKVVILCGGQGTRLREKTESIPKPLVEIGGKPILWHIMKMYEAHGFKQFVLCLGYKGNLIQDYFERNPNGWSIEFADTGEKTHTGGRIKKIEPLIQENSFMATYGDGVSDIDIKALVQFHKNHGKQATVTAVNPPSQFGILKIERDDTVTTFQEKPTMERWINGGFFVFEKSFFNMLGENDSLEKEPLEKVSSGGQLVAFRHRSFWKCMDTYKDNIELNEIWTKGNAPWNVWGKQTVANKGEEK